MKKLAPNLLSIIDIVESKREVMASEWIQISTVKTIFKYYHISPNKFKDGFGIPIIEYFISVVREEKKVGNCPVMTKLVLFLLEKNITPKDVFDICMGLRRTLVSFLFKEELIKDNPLYMMDEIADLFDANLSGVLNIFTSYYQEKQKTINQSLAYQQKLKQITKIINFINTKIIIVQNGRIIMANKSFLNTVGVDDIKGFYEKYKYSFSFMQDTDRYKEYFNVKNMNEWLEKVYENNKPFKTEIYNETHNKELMYSGRITALPDSDPIQYIISLNNINQNVEDKNEISKLMNRDELTGLNNLATFNQFLTEIQKNLKENSPRYALVIVDIPDLEEINKKKGRDYGDSVIISVAESMKSLADEKMKLSHIEGSKFTVLMPFESEQECYEWACLLQIQLNTSDEKKVVALTEIKPSDSVNRVQMRAYDIVEKENTLEEYIIQTDFKNIKPFNDLPDQENFTGALKDLEQLNTTLYYKELPINIKNEIVSIDSNSVTVKLSDKQLAVASQNGIIYIEIPDIGYVKAYIENINSSDMTMTLHSFVKGRYFPVSRKMIRIKAEKDVNATVRYNEVLIKATLLNLNEKYIALITDKETDLFKGSLVSVEMSLKTEKGVEYFTTTATVQKIKNFEDGYKIVLMCHLDNKSKNLLSSYIAKRQMDIIKEMKSKAII